MTLLELSAEYRSSGERCRDRVRELRELLRTEITSETERLLLRRRITMLTAMWKDSMAISRYLGNYYGGVHAKKANERDGL